MEARQTVILTDHELHHYLIWNTVFTQETLADEVLPWGFQLDSVYDDSCGSPYTGEQTRYVLYLGRHSLHREKQEKKRYALFSCLVWL